MRFAGKTGTARLGLRPDGGPMEYNSWFVGFVPWDAPRYAIAVLQNRTTREGAEVAPLALATAEILQELFGAW